ncbi:MAG: TraM recognition domain-containing protein [Candidatus Pacebacteria bacterium]|nr:TraM recognition domain-containing protein [Candidatus Paceibacterota bacterium]
MIRNIIGQDVNSFDLRKIMDERKILICNLSVGLTGKDNVDLIGSLLVTKIYLAALSRANLNYEELQKSPPFYLYVDEFQNFVNESFADILSQARKYNLGLIVAHQYIEQLDEETRASIFGNVGSMIIFRVGAVDAEYIERELAPVFTADDIVNLASREIVLRLSIDNISSKPFSAWTLKPIENENIDNKNAIINLSRALYGRPKFMIEDDIRD